MHARHPLRRVAALVLALFAATQAVPAVAGPDRPFVAVGSGMTAGVYWPVAQAICDLVNKAEGADGVWCSVEATPGSVYNLDALLAGELDFAIVQADNHYAAWNGEGRFEGHKVEDLRSVLSLYPEALTILAARDSGIKTFADLAGKRVNIGNAGSGTRATWEEVSERLGVPTRALGSVSELPAAAAAEQLCSGGIDASVLVVGHPSARVESQVRDCGATIVPIDGAVAEALIAARPYIIPTVIPAVLYGLPEDVVTFGGRATLVTRADVPDDIVAVIAKATLANFPVLKAKHPVLAGLRPTEMLTQSLSAPLHPGAVNAYRDLSLTP
jgi:TRAP transporter TAXI family solute receptor